MELIWDEAKGVWLELMIWDEAKGGVWMESFIFVFFFFFFFSFLPLLLFSHWKGRMGIGMI